MATSKYFNHTANTAQQNLISDLVTEAIQQRGIDVHYIPREVVEDNETLNEAEVSRFESNYPIEMYVERVDNFNGDASMFSKFGGFSLEDSMTLVISKTRYTEELSQVKDKPEQKDIIYIPYADLTLEIQKVLEDESFYQMGQNYVWRVKCTKFKYGNEDFETEVDDLDDMIDQLEMEADADLGGIQIVSQTQEEQEADPEPTPTRKSPIIDVDIGDVL